MQGATQQWYYRLERNQGTLTWTHFTELTNICLMHSNPLGELCHLRLDGSLDDYIDKFYQRFTRCDELSEPQQIAIFTAGLVERLKTDVELDAPNHPRGHAALARTYIRRSTVVITSPAPSSHHSSSRPTATTVVTPPTVSGAPVPPRPKAALGLIKLSRRDGSAP
jgi:hypothetical protein